MIDFEGVVKAGHGVASGRSAGTAANPYPQGSIAMQAPLFKERGLDLSNCFLGTINLDIAPQSWRLLKADHCFQHLRWTHLHPPETFSFVALEVYWQGAWHAGWLYYPHPETKATHFQSRSVVELILPKLQDICTGTRLQIRCRADRIALQNK